MLKRLIAAILALITMGALSVAAAAPASASEVHTCFGYQGTFAQPGTYPTFVYKDWPVGATNCFGISPGRHIWATAEGHPWSIIPGGGLADGLSGFREDVFSSSLYAKTVEVWVMASNHYYCQTWWSDTGWTGSWSRC
jgi:hypothetical protein